LLWRKNIRTHASTQQARFSVYVQADGVTPADSPAPQSPTPIITPGSGTQFPAISRTVVSMLSVQDSIASPNGWIPDGGTSTTGTHARPFLNTAADKARAAAAVDNKGRRRENPPAASRNRDFLGAVPRNFNYTPAPLGVNPDAGDAPSLPQSRRGA